MLIEKNCIKKIYFTTENNQIGEINFLFFKAIFIYI